MEKLTVNDPEYWGLAGVVTDEMAEVALCMDVRKPITLPKLAKKTKKPEAELEKLLQEKMCIRDRCNCDPKQLVGHIIGDKKPMDKRGVFREALCKCTAHQKITGIGD